MSKNDYSLNLHLRIGFENGIPGFCFHFIMEFPLQSSLLYLVFGALELEPGGKVKVSSSKGRRDRE